MTYFVVKRRCIRRHVSTTETSSLIDDAMESSQLPSSSKSSVECSTKHYDVTYLRQPRPIRRSTESLIAYRRLQQPAMTALALCANHNSAAYLVGLWLVA